MLHLMSFGYAVNLALFVVSRRIGKIHPHLVHKTLVEISKAFCGVYEVIIHIFFWRQLEHHTISSPAR
jgi:hypothetical protein